MFRYFVISWNTRDLAQSCAAHALIANLARRREWARALNLHGLSAFAAGARPNSSGVVLLRTFEIGNADIAAPAGAIFGTLFPRGSEGATELGRVRTLGSPECRAIVTSGGERLLDGWWGRYVAVLRDSSGAVRILRDPSGTLPCFTMQLRGVHLFFSDMEDCVSLERVPLSIDWNHVAAYVAGSGTDGYETGLAQVTEVEPGECVELRQGVLRRTLLWNPAVIASRLIENGAAACRALLQTTRDCVGAWASCYPGVVHSLSGGLDSSIVLSCLASLRPALSVTCLHHFGSSPDEDERRFARLAAGHFEIDLRERPLLPETADLTAILGIRRSPRLSSYIGSLQRRPLQVELAAEKNAAAIFTGAGGDGLFFQARAELAVADFMRIRGVRPALLSVALDAALVSRRSVWPLLASAWRVSNRSDRATSLWAQCARALGPGKQWQIASLARAPAFHDPLGHADDPERTHPLLSQPLIELCLRIPAYVAIEGGWDRAIARRAFSSSLPATIVQRRAKGSITQFSTALLDRNLSFVRELLLDGVLVRERILDRHALERSLASCHCLSDRASSEILHTHLSAEAWARRWCV